MHASNNSWPRPIAIAVGLTATTLAGAAWEILWYFLYMMFAFFTADLCTGITCVILGYMYFLGAIIPVLCLLFLGRAIVLGLTKDRVAARLALFVTLAWDVALGSVVWLYFWLTG